MKIFLALIIALFTITVCQDNQYTYSYLLQHPAVLKKEAAKCQSSHTNSIEQLSQCRIVFSAASTFMSILNDLQKDSAKFGQRIIDVQIACANDEALLANFRESITALKEKNVRIEELKAAESMLNKLQLVVDKEHEQINSYFAVIASS